MDDVSSEAQRGRAAYTISGRRYKVRHFLSNNWQKHTRLSLRTLRNSPVIDQLINANIYSMEVRPDPFEAAKSHWFDTSNWRSFCDVTLTSHGEV